MSSQLAELVIAQAQANGLAFLKPIRPNDVGVTGGHQKGFHLSLKVAHLFTPQPPDDGINHDHPIKIRWTDGTTTDSIVKWYGKKTRHEYRITCFNRIRNFRYIHPDRLGGVLVLIQEDEDEWLGHVLDDANDVDDVSSALGLALDDSAWAVYTSEGFAERESETTSECELREIFRFVSSLTSFPSTRAMSDAATQILIGCRGGLPESMDEAILDLVRVEYELFRAVERMLVAPLIQDGFGTVEEFLALSQTVLQRRKARAGRSLERHLEALLKVNEIPFEPQPRLDNTRPDFVFPSSAAYHAHARHSGETGVLVVSAKTTCKDRWRQVVQEGPRASRRYLVTLQQGISETQMDEIRQAGVQLVVPLGYHAAYAPTDRGSLMSVQEFFALAASVA